MNASRSSPPCLAKARDTVSATRMALSRRSRSSAPEFDVLVVIAATMYPALLSHSAAEHVARSRCDVGDATPAARE